MDNNSTSLTNGVSENAEAATTPASSSGVHHHLPQIATMDKGVKKAYSKSKQVPVAGAEKADNVISVSVKHVEGTGTVLKMSESETMMDMDDLLQQVETKDTNGVNDDKKTKQTEDVNSPKPVETVPPKKRGRKSKDQSAVKNVSSPAEKQPKVEKTEQRIKRIVKRKVPKTEFQEKDQSPKDVNKTKTVPFTVSAEMELLKPCNFQMGDMLWGKVGGHPWWPCMVSECPYTHIYTKLTGGIRISRMYHIQYFGNEGERGWINETSTIVFKGLKDFLDYADQQIKSAGKSTKQKTIQMFKVVPSRKLSWDIGVAQAEEAYRFDIVERLDKYTFVYDLKVDKSKENSDSIKETPKKRNKRKHNDNEDSFVAAEGTPVEKTAKRRKVDSNENETSPVQIHTRPKVVKYEASFDTFHKKHEESILDEHPDWSGELVRQHLNQQWSLMSEKQKARYKTKFTSETESSPPGKRSPRVSKPSIKKLEAEEDKKPIVQPVTLKTSSISTRKSLSETTSAEEKEQTTANAEKSAPEDEVNDTDKELKEKKSAGRPPRSKSRKSEPSASLITVDKQKAVVNKTEKSSAHVEEKEKKKSHKSKSVLTLSCPDSDSGSEKNELKNDLKSRVLKTTIQSGDGEYELDIFKLHATSNAKRENICVMCEQQGQLMECQGACQSFYHASCLKIEECPESEFKCHECSSGIHTCFGCKEASQDTRKCSVSSCGKFYHEVCFKKYPQSRIEGKSYFCPLHTCATCAADNPKNPKATKGRLLRCVRCPVAYHAGDFCLAAGSINLAGNYIVCSCHFQPSKTHRHHSHVNVSWCFQCSKGGTLLCCESCPAAYHPECLKMAFPEGSWYCPCCTSGKKPLYGDLIWIKIGSYRWWPGEICHPRNVPLNIQEKAHQVGEFPVRFFGSHDFYWTHQGRVFLFQEGDKGSKDTAQSKGLAKIFGKGVLEATEAFKIWQRAKENKEQLEKENNSKKPAHYKFVKTNIPIGNVQINKADLSEIPRCECRPDQENPCSNDSDCLNRMLMYECHAQTCPAGEKCQNQRFQKREYPLSESIKTQSRGWGLYTKVAVKKGQFVNEYVGDLVDEDECRRRIKQAHEDNISNFYMLTLDKNRVIDAGPKGNLSRFMNHSCQPNCETQKWMVNGDVRVGLFALIDIPAGSELTFNYNLECLGNEKTVCACGAENCSGFLGVRPKSAAAIASANRNKDVKKKKKKKKLDIKKEHDDDCFRCDEGGELVMCDHNTCPKVYHLQCLNLTKPPTGKWLCPWHHCDDCGKSAIRLCSKCPNSYCSKHIKGNIFEVEGTLYCKDHDNILSTFAPSKIKSPSAKIKEECVSNESSKASTPSSSSVQSDEDTNSAADNVSAELDTSAKTMNFKSVKKILTSGVSNCPAENNNVQVINRTPTTEALFPKNADSLTGNKPATSRLEPKLANRSPAAPKPGQKIDPATNRQRGRPCKTKAKMIANMKQGAARLIENKPMTPPQNMAVDELKKSTPMFDDSDEGESDLVIDIPQF